MNFKRTADKTNGGELALLAGSDDSGLACTSMRSPDSSVCIRHGCVNLKTADGICQRRWRASCGHYSDFLGENWRVEILGKGHKPGVAAISQGLAAQLQAYAYRGGLAADAKMFPFTRRRAFQVVEGAMRRAGVACPEHVGAVHVLRHSGALERLRMTGNPKSVQDQLRHSSARMTLRYFKTLQAEESLKVQQGVDFGW